MSDSHCGRFRARSGRSSRARRGFTLIEVMIVLAIILALSGLVAVAVFARQKESKASLTQIDMNTLKKGLQQFYLDFDRYPTDEEGLGVLWNKSSLTSEDEAAKWKKYIEEPMASDRWGTAWGYRQASEQGDDSTYDLWSNGPDKQEGTDDDITSWKKDAGDGAGDAAPAGGGATKGG